MENQSLEQPITITEKAAARLKNIMQSEEPSKKGIRVAIDTGGCSGMSYNITFDGEKKEFDKVLCELKTGEHGFNTFISFNLF